MWIDGGTAALDATAFFSYQGNEFYYFPLSANKSPRGTIRANIIWRRC